MTFPPELLPVLQITLPILLGMWVAVHSQNKRLDDIVGRLTALEAKMSEIESVLRSFGERIKGIETRLDSNPPGPKLVQSK